MDRISMGLTVIESHPVQYHAPVFRHLQSHFGIPVTAIYGSDSSVRGGVDAEFGTKVAWDTDLLSGYSAVFLSEGRDEPVSYGLGNALSSAAPGPAMVLGYGSKFDARALACAILSRRPILLRAETTDHARARSPLKRFVRDLSLRVAYDRCAQLLYIGQRSLQHYQRLGCGAEKLQFSPYCIDTTAFEYQESDRATLRNAARLDLGASTSSIVMLFSGKLSYRKGPDLLLEAVSQFGRDYAARVVIVFLGSGQMAEDLQATASDLGLRNPVFAGFQNQRHLSRFYHAADVLVLPSRRSETWGLVVNEAMHHGLPCVVSSAVGCAVDLVKPGQTGEIFDAGSSSALRAALQRIEPILGRGETREACRAQVSGYSVAEAAKGIAIAYRRVSHTGIYRTEGLS